MLRPALSRALSHFLYAPCAQVTALRERLADATADALAAGGRAEGSDPDGAGARGGGADTELLAVSDGRLQVGGRVKPASVSLYMKGFTL